MSNVISFIDIQKRQANRAARIKAEGATTWERLQRFGKLSRNDRTVLARNLHDTIKKGGWSKSEIADRAGFEAGPKEIHRLTLPPNTVARGDRLRAHTPRYVQLIRAVQQVTQQNIQSLVDDLTIGMSIHPREVKDFGAADKLQLVLQGYANLLDRRLDLLNNFRRIAELKAASIARGGLENWPFYPIETVSDSERLARHFSSPEHAFADPLNWGGSDHLQVDLHDGLRLLPRFYLGQIIDWQNECDEPAGPDPDERRRIQSRVHDWYLKNAPTQPGAPGGPLWSDKDIDSCWLVLYPTRHLTSIVPMLWICWEGFVEVNELNVRQLLRLKECDCVTTEVITIYERLETLVASGKLIEEWETTAKDLESVPFLVKDRSDRERANLLQQRFEDMWSGN